MFNFLLETSTYLQSSGRARFARISLIQGRVPSQMPRGLEVQWENVVEQVDNLLILGAETVVSPLPYAVELVDYKGDNVLGEFNLIQDLFMELKTEHHFWPTRPTWYLFFAQALMNTCL
jgi:hypothetical protein